MIRETGLIDKASEAGVTGGGLEVAGDLRRRPAGLVDATPSRPARPPRRRPGADSFLAVGGGSVMDTAKVANVALQPRRRPVLDYEGLYTLPREDDGLGAPLPVAPLACIPTTAGTGSEVSIGAVIKDPEQQIKVLIGDFPLFPRLAILDPEATRDAAAADRRGHRDGRDDPRDRGLHDATRGARTARPSRLQALRMIRDNLPVAVEDPSNEDARGNMLVAACLAIVPGAGGDLGPRRGPLDVAPRRRPPRRRRTGSRTRSTSRT